MNMSNSEHSEKNNSAHCVIKSESTKTINGTWKQEPREVNLTVFIANFPEITSRGNEWDAHYSTWRSRSSLTSSKNPLVKSSEAEDLSFEAGGSNWYCLNSMVKVKKSVKPGRKWQKMGTSKTNWSQNSAKVDCFVWQADQHFASRRKQEREPWERTLSHCLQSIMWPFQKRFREDLDFDFLSL